MDGRPHLDLWFQIHHLQSSISRWSFQYRCLFQRQRNKGSKGELPSPKRKAVESIRRYLLWACRKGSVIALWVIILRYFKLSLVVNQTTKGLSPFQCVLQWNCKFVFPEHMFNFENNTTVIFNKLKPGPQLFYGVNQHFRVICVFVFGNYKSTLWYVKIVRFPLSKEIFSQNSSLASAFVIRLFWPYSCEFE